MFEQLGYLDAPTAWNVWNGNIGFAAALLDDEAVSIVWSDGPTRSSATRPGRRARPPAESDGFRLSGRWDIVSGVDNADWITLFGIVMDGLAAAHDRRRTGHPGVLPASRADVQILDTWHTAGMRGTGSNAVVVDNAFVPAHLAISPFAPSRLDRPTYRIPAFTLASTGAAPIVVGATQAAIDEVLALARPRAQTTGSGWPSGLTPPRSSARRRLRSTPPACSFGMPPPRSTPPRSPAETWTWRSGPACERP